MKKLVVIGIDSMDKELVYKYLDDLPTLRKMIEESPKINLRSVFPPDSDTAWASIYTGLNPAKHGIVNFVDPLEKASIYQSEYPDNQNIRNRTFWDYAGKSGKRVCIIFPHIAYPTWPVNGLFISSKPGTGEIQIYPKDFNFDFEFDNLEIPIQIPNSESEYRKYLKDFEKIVINEFSFARNILTHYDSDLFLFYSSALDFVQHIFWNYCDQNDPTYPGDNEFRDTIRNFYILHDKLIARLLEHINSDTGVMIVSDHGHMMRPINLVNINEILRLNGYLFPVETRLSPLIDLFEQFKRFVAEYAQKTGLRATALAVLRKYPKIKELYTIPSSVDFQKTIAHCTDMSGIKAYSYGGIVLNKNGLTQDESLHIRQEIIDLLLKFAYAGSNENLFEWVCAREDLYAGMYIERYPDILFKLKEGMGAGWSIKTPIFSKSLSHSFFPGSHRGDSPLFILVNANDKKPFKSTATLMDVSPTILDLLGVDYGGLHLDGNSLCGHS